MTSRETELERVYYRIKKNSNFLRAYGFRVRCIDCNSVTFMGISGIIMTEDYIPLCRKCYNKAVKVVARSTFGGSSGPKASACPGSAGGGPAIFPYIPDSPDLQKSNNPL